MTVTNKELPPDGKLWPCPPGSSCRVVAAENFAHRRAPVRLYEGQGGRKHVGLALTGRRLCLDMAVAVWFIYFKETFTFNKNREDTWLTPTGSRGKAPRNVTFSVEHRAVPALQKGCLFVSRRPVGWLVCIFIPLLINFTCSCNHLRSLRGNRPVATRRLSIHFLFRMDSVRNLKPLDWLVTTPGKIKLVSDCSVCSFYHTGIGNLWHFNHCFVAYFFIEKEKNLTFPYLNFAQ